jgi:hypothetical protein
VAFSDFPTLVVKPNQLDMILRCDFVDLVEVFYIPAISDFGREVLKTLWYTNGEIKETKRNAEFLGREVNLRIGRHRLPREDPTTIVQSLLSCKNKRNSARCATRSTGRLVDSSDNRRSSGIVDPEQLREVLYARGNITIILLLCFLNKKRCFKTSYYFFHRIIFALVLIPSIHSEKNPEVSSQSYHTKKFSMRESINNQSCFPRIWRARKAELAGSFSGLLLMPINKF